MKILYRVALALWLVSGLAMYAYFTRVATPAADRETQQLRQLAQSSEERDAAFRRIGEIWSDLRLKEVRAVALWGLVGFLLALRGVHLLFEKADGVAAVERFLAASLMLAILAGTRVPALSAIDNLGAPVISQGTGPSTGDIVG